MKEEIKLAVDGAIKAVSKLKEDRGIDFINSCAEMIAACFQKGNKIIVAGNGGSLCDAMHFAEELTGFFRDKRKALPAIVLSEPGHLTCVGNDVGFDHVFSRGVEAFGKKDDIFIGLTTSGNSQNILNAVMTAKKMGVKTICFLGKGGGKMKGLCELEWVVDGFKTSDRIQEAHMSAIHIIIEIVEKIIFKEDFEKAKTLLSDALLQNTNAVNAKNR